MNALNLIPAITEIFLVLAIMLILVVSLFFKEENGPVSYTLSLIVLAVCAVLSYYHLDVGLTTTAFGNMFVADPLANLLKLAACIATAITLIYSRLYTSDRGMLSGFLSGEFYVLALLTLLGQMIMISGNNFLIIYLGLEMMSLSLYALVALRRDHVASTEASMKYFILGALASGFMLYGISMLYGATGTLDLSRVATATADGSANKIILVFGLVFLVAGLAFKLGTAPFHMWVPDVYQGSPTSVTLLLGAAPKLAAFAICIRFLVEGLGALVADWQQMLTVMAVVSIAVGNITAIAQTNIKRMLAYSTISQMGFMLLGLLSGYYTGAPADAATNAYSSALFYALTYVFTTLGTFGVVMLLARQGFEADNLDDYKGLNQRNPWFAAVMMMLLLSLAGLPPMVGFYAKLSVLQAVFATGQIWLALFAVLFSLIGAYYYLRIVKLMYFDEAVDKHPIVINRSMGLTLSANGLAVLVVGIWPSALMALCTYSISRVLAS
jgi:NADH-quinone oxidoreductase subunit N